MSFPAILAAGLAALLSAGCPCKESTPAPDREIVAEVEPMSQGFEVRRAGELDFEPWKDGMKLTAGMTIRTRANDSVSLLFMRNIQVQLGKTDPSELILEGALEDGQGKAYLLGLKEGDVWVQSYADEPIVLKMPHAEVRGRGVYFTVHLERREDGTYVAEVNALSLNVFVSNAHGTLQATQFGNIRADETEPPVFLKSTGPRR
jgi:hypothetical protein